MATVDVLCRLFDEYTPPRPIFKQNVIENSKNIHSYISSHIFKQLSVLKDKTSTTSADATSWFDWQIQQNNNNKKFFKLIKKQSQTTL